MCLAAGWGRNACYSLTRNDAAGARSPPAHGGIIHKHRRGGGPAVRGGDYQFGHLLREVAGEHVGSGPALGQAACMRRGRMLSDE